MTIRYRVVPKDKSKSGFYVDFDEKKVTVEAIDAQLSSLTSLQNKLKEYYDSHGIDVEEIDSNAGASFCYAWTGDDTGFDVPESYAGGCGVSDILDAIEAKDRAEKEKRRKAEEAAYIKNFAKEQKRPFPVSINQAIDEEEDDFVPFGDDQVELSFMDNSPVIVNQVAPSLVNNSTKSTNTGSVASYGSGSSSYTGNGKYPQGQSRTKDQPTAECNILGPKIEGEPVTKIGRAHV